MIQVAAESQSICELINVSLSNQLSRVPARTANPPPPNLRNISHL
jgi:hypothetical protein